MPKRAPIDYTPVFGGGVFRAKEAIAEELAAETDAWNAAGTQDVVDVVVRTLPPPDPTVLSRPINRSTVRTNERTNERFIVRHSFDIGQDQLLALAEIQMDRFQQTGRKPKLGPLVQEALDAYIAKQRRQQGGRTNERTNERTVDLTNE